MKIPAKIPGLKWLIAIVGLYGFVWIGLEGKLWQAILLAAGLVLSSELYLLQRLLGDRQIGIQYWLLICAGLGCAGGLGCILLTLALMAVKTGLHGHGPEFTAAEIEWLLGQIPLWTVSATIAGVGLGLLVLASPREK